MSDIDLNIPLNEYFFLKLWFKSKFDQDEEYMEKAKRFLELDKRYGGKLHPSEGRFRKRVGRYVQSEIVKSAKQHFDKDQWMEIEREAFRVIEKNYNNKG